MLYSAFFTSVHAIAHAILYALPRWAWMACVRWPVQLLASVLGVRAHEWDERRLIILGPSDKSGASSSSSPVRTRERLGITESQLSNVGLPCGAGKDVGTSEPSWMRYNGPLYNGHLHTILGAYRPPIHLRAPTREFVLSYDGNPACLDWWLPTPSEAASAASCSDSSGSGSSTAARVRVLVVILPGLTGSSGEFYVRRMARLLLANNMAVCVLNARGVADTPLEKPQTFSALFTKDIRHVLQTHLTPDAVRQRLWGEWLPLPMEEETKRDTPFIFGVAFSLGGLIMTNYVSEQGEAGAPSGFDAVYCITSPHNVSDGAAALRVPLTKLIYDPVLYKGLRNYYERHKDVLRYLPGIDAARVMGGPAPLIDRFRGVQEFDEYITGPHFGFPGAEAYYAAASSFRRLHHSRTPQVCIVAANDPICGPPQPRARWLHLIQQHSGGLVYVEMPTGGHLGFLGSPLEEWRQAPSEMERFVLYSLTHFMGV